jgi:hypothetical protein
LTPTVRHTPTLPGAARGTAMPATDTDRDRVHPGPPRGTQPSTTHPPTRKEVTEMKTQKLQIRELETLKPTYIVHGG